MSAISIQLPQDLDTRLDELAANSGREKSEYILDALNEYIGDLEDIQIAQQRLADHRAGRSRTYTLEEVERELGLAD